MKYVLGAAALVCAAAAFWTSPVAACESCISDGGSQVACISSPGAGGEICTSGGGHCNQEGRCQVSIERMTAEGSLLTEGATLAADQAGGGAEARIARRECDDAVIARWYAPESAERMRRETVALSI